MDRRQLEHFLAVATRGSFTSAASALHVAQPSLSHSIRNLERELGAPLFHRLGRGVKLTPEGQVLVSSAQDVLRAFGAAQTAVQQVKSLESGQLDIVALTTLAVDPLARLVGLFRRAHPGVDVRIHDPEHTAAVAEMVRGGECELGLSDTPTSANGIATLELRQQELVVVLPPDAEPCGPAVTITDVAQMDLIATPPGTTTRMLLEQAMAGSDVPVRIAVETSHRAAILPLVLAGAGAALLPRAMSESAHQEGALVRQISPPLLRPVLLFARPKRLSRVAAAFVRIASESEQHDRQNDGQVLRVSGSQPSAHSPDS